MLDLYGIKNCDSVKKARRWLEENDVQYTFHDFRDEGIDDADLAKWMDSEQGIKLLNKRSTTWKNLSEADKSRAEGETLMRLLKENPTLIKRPVAQLGEQTLVGFSASDYKSLTK